MRAGSLSVVAHTAQAGGGTTRLITVSGVVECGAFGIVHLPAIELSDRDAPRIRCVVEFIGIAKPPRPSPLLLHVTDTNGGLIARLETANVEVGTKEAVFDGYGDVQAFGAAIRKTMGALDIAWGYHTAGPVFAEVDIRLPPGKELRDHQSSGVKLGFELTGTGVIQRFLVLVSRPHLENPDTRSASEAINDFNASTKGLPTLP